MPLYDITLLTDKRYDHPTAITPYIQNILTEDKLLREALEKKGLSVNRTHWDNPDFDWTQTRYALFRTTWDYFERFPEFKIWLEQTSKLTTFINPLVLIHQNMDKHYLLELQKKGVNIPDTIFIEPGEMRSLQTIVQESNWTELILKPAVSGAARHTYRFLAENAAGHEAVFRELIANEAMMLQAFQHNILTKGEVAFMVFGGQYSHAILKIAKPGDFRVQDDFGGSVHDYTASPEEIAFVEKTMSALTTIPAYARVDMIWDNEGRPAVSELEMIEPELWMRKDANAATRFATVLLEQYF